MFISFDATDQRRDKFIDLIQVMIGRHCAMLCFYRTEEQSVITLGSVAKIHPGRLILIGDLIMSATQ